MIKFILHVGRFLRELAKRFWSTPKSVKLAITVITSIVVGLIVTVVGLLITSPDFRWVTTVFGIVLLAVWSFARIQDFLYFGK